MNGFKTRRTEAKYLVKSSAIQVAAQLVETELTLVSRLFLCRLSQAQDQRLQLFDFEDLISRDEFEESVNQGFQGFDFKEESIPFAQPRRRLFRVKG